MSQSSTAASRAMPVRLSALPDRLQRLAQHWDVDAARAFAAEIDELLEDSHGELAERIGDLSAYLAVFADGALLPTRTQIDKLHQLLRAVTGSDFPIEPESSGDTVVAMPERRARAAEQRNAVAILDVADTLAPGLTATLSERGYLVRHFSDTSDLEAWLEVTRPGVLLINAQRLRALPRLSARLGDAAIGSPLGPALLVLSGTRDLTHRLLAMRAGASAYFGAPLDSYRIVARIEELLGREQATPYRVLLVDANREHAAQCGRWMMEQGMTARLAFDAQGALSAATEFRPDIAVVDFDLPDARGFELVQVLHQQPEFATLPIVLFADDEDETQRFDAIAAGADEVLVKPLKPRHLVSVITSRVRRAQWLRGQAGQTAGRDSRTGLFLRSHLIEHIGQSDIGRGAALMFIAFDRVEQLRETIGLSGLAQVESEIAQVFRETLSRGDMAAAMRDFAYLLLVARDHRDQVTELAERLRQKFSQRQAGTSQGANLMLTASIGITSLDETEPDVDARVARADAAAGAAQRVGGNRVLWYEPNDFSLVRPSPELAVRAVLSRPWRDDNARIEFRPLVPLSGKLFGQFDLDLNLVSTQEPTARAEYGIYAPVAHELGALREIERRRLTAALDAREQRLKLGKQIRIFMPIAAASLEDTVLVDWLTGELAARNLSGTGLTLELPSGQLLDRREQLEAPLARLRAAGVRLGLCDFGRDWAAVHLLNHLSVDFLRLDPELVLNTTNANAVSNTMLALVRKAHHLGAAVIAPSVDSIERAHILIRLGIDYGSGDGLGRAQREPEFDFNRPIW
ncbi:MAG TPA: EAL domain-containing protein [Candidatus Saccharimonadia bacterium]|nr:EAL domain-containing protein [Candidatus Saccharimonadia bacterium]